MKVEPKIGGHLVNPESPAKNHKNLNTIVAKSLPIQGGIAKSTFSSKIPNEKESARITQAAFRQILERGKK